VRKLDADWLRQEVGSRMPLEIRVWRSVSVRWLRALMHTALGGKYCLRLLFWMEERWPKYFGENGQYPLIIVRGGTVWGQRGVRRLRVHVLAAAAQGL